MAPINVKSLYLIGFSGNATLLTASKIVEPGVSRTLVQLGHSLCDASQVPNALHEVIRQLRFAVAGFGRDSLLLIVEAMKTVLAAAGTAKRAKAELRPQETAMLLGLGKTKTSTQ